MRRARNSRELRAAVAGDKAPAEQFAKGVGSAQGAATHQPTLSPAAATAPPVTPIGASNRSSRLGARLSHRRPLGRRWRWRWRRRQSSRRCKQRWLIRHAEFRGARATPDAARAARHPTACGATPTGQRLVSTRLHREHGPRRKPGIHRQGRSRARQAWHPCRSRPPAWNATPSPRRRPREPCSANAATPAPP